MRITTQSLLIGAGLMYMFVSSRNRTGEVGALPITIPMRLGYFNKHRQEIMKSFPLPQNLKRSEQRAVNAGIAYFVTQLQQGQSSERAAEMARKMYINSRGKTGSIMQAFGSLAQMDSRIPR